MELDNTTRVEARRKKGPRVLLTALHVVVFFALTVVLLGISSGTVRQVIEADSVDQSDHVGSLIAGIYLGVMLVSLVFVLVYAALVKLVLYLTKSRPISWRPFVILFTAQQAVTIIFYICYLLLAVRK